MFSGRIFAGMTQAAINPNIIVQEKGKHASGH
jgi:hypothetical protein